MQYDYLIIGSGLFGSVCARELTDKGHKCLVLEKRDHIGGNCYTEKVEGINVHKYGAHIFHTSNKEVWTYVNKFVEFNSYKHHVLASYDDKLFSLPFNMFTFNQLWNVNTPQEAKHVIEQQRFVGQPSNLEEQALSLVGRDIYEKLIKGYTEKQWMKLCTELPPFIIKRLPVRFTFDNNYFFDPYQGIPKNGYTELFDKLLNNIEVRLNTDYFEKKQHYNSLAKKIIYTGPVDKFYDYCFGELEYRPLRFEHTLLDQENYQGHSVINYTKKEVPYTRIIEHKHFNNDTSSKTIITKEYPIEWSRHEDPYYPINDKANEKKYAQYRELTLKEKNTIFGGRLAEYKYYDMHQVVESALNTIKTLI